MTTSRASRCPRGRRRAAFSLVEVVVSVLIVSGLFVAALSALAAAKTGQYVLTERNRGVLLAQDLLTEILQQPYEDPETPGVFGCEGAEAGTTRQDFDDVDDYRAWSASPPQMKDGSAIPGTEGYARSVTVQWANPANLDELSASPTGVKRITVTVKHNDRIVGQLFGVRTEAWQDPTAEAGGAE
jgi:type II secretory pathway pseudopilin PulG